MKILEEITRRSGGIRLREDNILFLLSVKLKEICVQYDVFLMSSTQLNGDWKTSEIPDQNLLRGAKSIADKIDFGAILLDVQPEEHQQLQSLVESLGCAMPNVKMSVYKNRRGKYVRCYLWMIADKGTCRFDPVFATDYKGHYIEMEKTQITITNEEKPPWEE